MDVILSFVFPSKDLIICWIWIWCETTRWWCETTRWWWRSGWVLLQLLLLLRFARLLRSQIEFHVGTQEKVSRTIHCDVIVGQVDRLEWPTPCDHHCTDIINHVVTEIEVREWIVEQQCLECIRIDSVVVQWQNLQMSALEQCTCTNACQVIEP